MRKRLFLIVFTAAICLPLFSQRIFLTGDSHVSAKVYPREVKKLVEKAKPSANVDFWGKGSAGFYTFNDTPAYMDSIFNANPDILVVHLGTNGCYNVPLDAEKTLNDIEIFYGNVRSNLPECKIVFVTPFYNKNRNVISSDGGEKVYGPWKVNEKTRQCSDIIVDFANKHNNTFVIDNNSEVGMRYLKSPRLIRPDNVHLTEAGYKDLGSQVGADLLAIDAIWE